MATAAAVVVSVALSLLVGGLLTRHALKRSIVTNLGRQADVLALRVEAAGPGFLRPRRLRQIRQARGLNLVYVPLSTAEGLLPGDASDALRTGRGAQGEATVGGRGILYAARPVAGKALVLFRSARLRQADWRPFLDSFLIAGAVGAAIAALVAFLLARAIGGPVLRVARASRELAAGGSPAAVPVEGPEEIATLAAAFNTMHDDLAAARERERSFLLSVSHELKTPLTAIRGYAEAMCDGAVTAADGGEVIGREAARLDRLVHDLLDLARLGQGGFDVRSEPVDLTAVAHDVVRRYERQAEEFGVALVAEVADGAGARADFDRLVQVVSNLVENALRMTPSGGRVAVRAEPGSVVVEDTGPGLAAEDLPHAFERFYLYRRHADARPVGSGLGLAIVRELTAAMGGSVSVESRPGAGARFTVRLPQGPNSPAAPPPGLDARGGVAGRGAGG